MTKKYELEHIRVIEALKTQETLIADLKRKDHLISSRDTEIQALMNKVTILEKCNRDVFMELDQSVCQNNLLNKSGLIADPNISNIQVSPSKLLVSEANQSKFEITVEEIVQPLIAPEKIRKSYDGNFIEQLESDQVLILQLK